MKKQPLIAIVGPTGSGKSALAVSLARRFGGEIISADSRQVYRGCDIGTEKISKKETRGVSHHLIDVADPKRTYSVDRFKRDAAKAIGEIISRGKIPIVVGGTGLYVDTLLLNKTFPEVPSDPKLRAQLEKKTARELYAMLRKLDPRRAKEIDRQNPRRLMRAIEIAKALGRVPLLERTDSPYEVLWIGLRPEDARLRALLAVRLSRALKRGLIGETKRLHQEGVSFKRLNELGLEYRLVASYLQGNLSKQELSVQLEKELWQYVRRQKTWFKRNTNIHWLKPEQKKEVEKLVREFLP